MVLSLSDRTAAVSTGAVTLDVHVRRAASLDQLFSRLDDKLRVFGHNLGISRALTLCQLTLAIPAPGTQVPQRDRQYR